MILKNKIIFSFYLNASRFFCAAPPYTPCVIVSVCFIRFRNVGLHFLRRGKHPFFVCLIDKQCKVSKSLDVNIF